MYIIENYSPQIPSSLFRPHACQVASSSRNTKHIFSPGVFVPIAARQGWLVQHAHIPKPSFARGPRPPVWNLPLSWEIICCHDRSSRQALCELKSWASAEVESQAGRVCRRGERKSISGSCGARESSIRPFFGNVSQYEAPFHCFQVGE